ncbi:MAG: tRNA lysidine(34) synthetase TilS [Gammaproteobacteria bacterium]
MFFNPSHNKLLQNAKRIFIAYSGGIDSHVLLHNVVQNRTAFPKSEIVAIHIDHEIYPDSKKWSLHCRKICQKLGVKIIIKKIAVKKKLQKGQSIEEVARTLRYQAFASSLKKGDVLLSAHHSTDQAETLLLQLLRGAGVKGLAAMPAVSKLGDGTLIRPLLDCSRQDLETYAKKHSLNWIEDQSNADTKFARNYLRQKIIPALKKYWPSAEKTLTRVTIHAAEASNILEELAVLDYEKIQGSKKNLLSQKKLKLLSEARQRNVLRYAIHSLGFSMPSSAKMQDIQKNILESRYDKTPLVAWGEAEMRRYGDDIYILKSSKKISFKPILWKNLNKPLVLPDSIGILHCENCSEKTAKALKNKISVRWRTGAESIKIPKRNGTHSLKKLLQEWRIPPWQRTKIPLIYYGDKIIEIVGYACSEYKVETRLIASLHFYVRAGLVSAPTVPNAICCGVSRSSCILRGVSKAV